MYARHGQQLGGASPLGIEVVRTPAGGNGVTARWGRKEARGKAPTRGTRTAYEA